MIKLYYNTLMWALRLVAGDKEVTTWTFHKGCLRLLGNDWVNRNSRWSFLRILWLAIYPASYVLLLVTSTVLTVKIAIQMEKKTTLQFIRAVNGFIVSIPYVYATSKALIFKYHGKEILKLMDMIDNLGSFDEVGSPKRDRSLLASSLYMGLLFVTPGTWTIYFTLFHQAIPYPTDFPWDQDTTLGYVFTFGTDFVTAVYCAGLHSVYDTIFPVVVGALSGHVASLNFKLSTLGSKENQGKDKDILRECYQKHVNIIRVLKQMNDCFRLLFLCQATYTVIHACVIIYQVMQVSDIALAIMNTSPILSSAYFQLLMYCYYGQLLTTNFDDLKMGLYRNRWYSCNLDVKKNLNIMILMADRPIKLDSYGITFAGHATYLSSLQDSVSYYLILKTLTTEE